MTAMSFDEPWPCVVLRHDLPDGSSHVDWLLAPAPGSGSDSGRARDPLITFRIDRSPTQLAVGAQLAATRLADHRAIYLDYEGEVSGGRGCVTRLHRGRITRFDHSAQARVWTLSIEWAIPHSGQHFLLQPIQDDRWIVICQGNPPQASS